MRSAALIPWVIGLASCLTDFDDFTFVPEQQSATSTSTSASTGSAGGGAPGPQVACGALTCDVADGTCCLTKPGGEGRCLPAGEECLGNETSVWCDGPEDCTGGEICCGDTTVGFDLLRCRPNCDGPGQIVICDSSEPDPCPGNDDCVPSITLPNGYEVCN